MPPPPRRDLRSAIPGGAAGDRRHTQFLALLDSLMVAVALPVIARELHLTTTELPWVVNAYTLALAGGALAGGLAIGLLGWRWGSCRRC